jgi:beta-N-acetylhexosaminidase
LYNTYRGWDVGNWNHHEFYAIRLLRNWKPSTLPEKVTLNHEFKYDLMYAKDEEELGQHLLMGTGFGVGSSALGHPAVISDLYRRAQADTQGCKIVLARNAHSGKIIGSVVLYHSLSQINPFFPVDEKQTGGLAGIVVSGTLDAASVVHGLVTKSAMILNEMGFLGAQIFIVRVFTTYTHTGNRLTDQVGDPVFPPILTRIGFQRVSEFLSINKAVSEINRT